MAINDLSKVFGIPSPTGTLDLTPQFQISPATGTLGLEQPSTLQRAGSRISNNLARMGGYDPMQLSTEEQRKQARLAGLEELSYKLSQASARLSGDPRRIQLAQEREAARVASRQPAKIPTSAQEFNFAQGNPAYAEFLNNKKSNTEVNINSGTSAFSDRTETIYSKSMEDAYSAQNTMASLNEMDSLLDSGVQTGGGVETLVNAKQVMQTIFPDLIDAGELAKQENFLSVSLLYLTPKVKQLGTNPTDADLALFKTALPTLGKSVAGNKLIIDMLRLVEKRKVMEAEFVNSWLRENQDIVKSNAFVAGLNLDQALLGLRQTDAYSMPAKQLIQRRQDILEQQRAINNGEVDSIELKKNAWD